MISRVGRSLCTFDAIHESSVTGLVVLTSAAVDAAAVSSSAAAPSRAIERTDGIARRAAAPAAPHAGGA
eukprot:3314943-Pleurochrysis_carterae.AAC.1